MLSFQLNAKFFKKTFNNPESISTKFLNICILILSHILDFKMKIFLVFVFNLLISSFHYKLILPSSKAFTS